MNMNHLFALGLLVLTAGCASDKDSDGKTTEQRFLAVVPAGSGIDGCADIQQVCTMSYPSTCYDFCADQDPTCKKVEVCTQSYPSTCHELCEGPTAPPDECDSTGTAVDSDGNEFPICVIDPGGTGGGVTPPGEPCTKVWVCQQTYPEICHEICQDNAGGGSPPSGPGGSAPGSPGQ